MKIYYYEFPIGTVGIAEESGAVCRVSFGKGSVPASCTLEETPLIRTAATQLTEYFDGKRTAFDLPLSPVGTEFRQKVWSALLAIPYGQTKSYREIAEAAGCPRGCRAVGMANHFNPIAIIIPCHRVVETGGGLGGYAGGIATKQFLLDLEREIV